jgi:hypothetical protein
VTLSRRTAAGLLTAGVWTVVNWVTFARNLDTDGRSTGFVVVHTVLIVVNSALGVWLASLGLRALRRPQLTGPSSGAVTH